MTHLTAATECLTLKKEKKYRRIIFDCVSGVSGEFKRDMFGTGSVIREPARLCDLALL